jgi:hypothetical protein
MKVILNEGASVQIISPSILSQGGDVGTIFLH